MIRSGLLTDEASPVAAQRPAAKIIRARLSLALALIFAAGQSLYVFTAAAALKPLTPQVAPTDAPADAGTPSAASTKPAAAPTKPATPATAPTSASTPKSMPPAAPAIKEVNAVTELERIIFGSPEAGIALNIRLDHLESEVFHQTNPEWDVEKRISRLERTIIGTGSNPADGRVESGGSRELTHPGETFSRSTGAASPGSFGGVASPYTGSAGGDPYLPSLPSSVPNMQLDAGVPPPAESTFIPMPADLNAPEYNQDMSRPQLEQFALEIINRARYQHGLAELKWDDTGYKVSKELVNDLCKRNTVSHANAAGENPDVRYSKLGGADCLVESIVGIRLKGRPRPNKALVYGILKELTSHQDDRDALFSRYASGFAFTFDISNASDKIVACAETITKQAQIEPIPTQAAVGEKIDVRGVLTGPYRFSKITVAWEGLPPPDDSQDQDEAAPYFPPLDYEAHARKAEHDYTRLKQTAQLAGVGLALAGGVFFPPAALAAPLIMAGSGVPKPKAVSEIPVRGGVKCEGPVFVHKLPLSNQNKEGIYYVTIWAQGDEDPAPFALSRRAVIVKGTLQTTTEVEKEKSHAAVTATRDKKEIQTNPRDK